MTSFRLQRLSEQIQEEISALLLKGLKDPRIGFVTITGVDISPDLSRAWVYFCTPGSVEERERSRSGLQSAAGFIRKALGKRLHIKQIPAFEFRYDTSLDRGDKIERILSEVREKEGWDDPTRVRGSAEEVARALGESQSCLVTSHTNPDGDAIASVLAMGHLLDLLGKQAVMYNPDEVPANYAHLPGAEQIEKLPGEGPYDTTIVMDCSELSRVGPLPPAERLGRIIGIDHHLTAEPLGDVYYLDPGASSIGEMIDRILEHLPAELDLTLATCIYCSILSDTGSFRYSNTSPAALRSAARMVAQGVSPWDMARQVYESQPRERLLMLASVLPSLHVDQSGLYASILVSREMFESTGATADMIDGFINYPRRIEGVEVAIQFREVEQKRYKISFRSRGNANVAAIAEQFGGGGHANAAGCTLSGSFEEVRDKIYQAVEATLNE
jgi:phosphoesterase RecJ-like protein